MEVAGGDGREDSAWRGGLGHRHRCLCLSPHSPCACFDPRLASSEGGAASGSEQVGPSPNPTYINWGLFPPPGELSPSQEGPWISEHKGSISSRHESLEMEGRGGENGCPSAS